MAFLIGFLYCVFFAIVTTPIWQMLNIITWERKGSLTLKAKRELFFFPAFLIGTIGLSGYILNIYYKRIQFSDCQICPKNVIVLGLISGILSMLWGYAIVMRRKRQLLIWQEQNRGIEHKIDIKPKPITISNVYAINSLKKAEKQIDKEETFKSKLAQKKMGKHLEVWENKFKSKADKIIDAKKNAAADKKQKRKEELKQKRQEAARIRKKMLADKEKAEKRKK